MYWSRINNLLIRPLQHCPSPSVALYFSSHSSLLDMHSKLDRVRQVDWDEIKGIRHKKGQVPPPSFLNSRPEKVCIGPESIIF